MAWGVTDFEAEDAREKVRDAIALERLAVGVKEPPTAEQVSERLAVLRRDALLERAKLDAFFALPASIQLRRPSPRLEEGLGRDDIAESLERAARAALVERAPFYWETVAASFIAQGR